MITTDSRFEPLTRMSTLLSSPVELPLYLSFPRTNQKGAHWSSIVYEVTWRVYHHARTHTRMGIVCSVAYFDLGNWGVDIQAGLQFGYSLLFCVLPAGLLAAVLQVLAGRLGVVTGLDFASHCRLLLHDRPQHKMLWCWGVLYPLDGRVCYRPCRSVPFTTTLGGCLIDRLRHHASSGVRQPTEDETSQNVRVPDHRTGTFCAAKICTQPTFFQGKFAIPPTHFIV
ncbi:hypothetical protein EDD15DRAFT_854078 [Pisolithus albus]|nr:hypothetical protein EDD15DRAFT_854078 [Pisolithus albus]